jgi:dienelactone hydrolase
MRRLAGILSLTSLFLPSGVLASGIQTFDVPSLDGTVIQALVFQPEQAARGTVVALHGCGGLFATAGTRKGQLNARHQGMADLLVAQGYAVVFPDSLAPRGAAQLCTQKMGERNITQTERRRDTLVTLNWVAAQPWATPSKMALLGWSHGGSAVLSATQQQHPEVLAQSVRAAVAIAFYPGCSAATRASYQSNAPLILMLGEKDDWTAPGPCIALGRTVGAEVNVFADSYHDFDNPVGEVRLRKDVPNGVNPGQGVHVGPNPAAREKAYARVLDALRVAFESPRGPGSF